MLPERQLLSGIIARKSRQRRRRCEELRYDVGPEDPSGCEFD